MRFASIVGIIVAFNLSGTVTFTGSVYAGQSQSSTVIDPPDYALLTIFGNQTSAVWDLDAQIITTTYN